jgi:hypothetical protein
MRHCRYHSIELERMLFGIAVTDDEAVKRERDREHGREAREGALGAR